MDQVNKKVVKVCKKFRSRTSFQQTGRIVINWGPEHILNTAPNSTRNWKVRYKLAGLVVPEIYCSITGYLELNWAGKKSLIKGSKNEIKEQLTEIEKEQNKLNCPWSEILS